MAARDYLNVEKRTDLRDWVFQNGQCVAVLGVVSQADIPLETWYFDDTSMAIDNGTNFATAFKPNDIPLEEPGRYLPIVVLSDWNKMINKPTILGAGTPNNFTPSLNTASVIHPTKQASVVYSLSLTVTNPLIAGSSTARAFLEYSIDSGTTWVIVSQVSNSSAVSITVTLQLTNTQSCIISGAIPAGAQRRIRSTTTGTASVTMLSGQETY